MRTMEAAGSAFWADTVASAVIVVKAGNFSHESFKGLQFSGSVIAHGVILLSRGYLPSDCKSCYFQLSGNKKRGVRSVLRDGDETNPS